MTTTTQIDRLAFKQQNESPTTRDIMWPAKWFGEVFLQIQSMRLLKENWDSYGAARISTSSILRACEMLEQLARITDERPSVGPTPLGNVNLWWTWDQGTKSIELEFFPDGRLHACFTNESDSSKDYEAQDSSWAKILSLIPGA